MGRETLTTAEDVIDALGGVAAVSRLFGFDRRNVSNWKTRGLPSESYYALSTLLRKKGYAAPLTLWRQYELIDPKE